jgi:excisionase family DNA binding protein
MTEQGIDEHLLRTLQEGFAGRPTVQFAEAAKLLNLNEKTLRRHVRRGSIAFRQTGLGKVRVRREFALRDLVQFYARALRRLGPTAEGPVARTCKGAQPSFLDGYARRRAARQHPGGIRASS